VWSKLGDDSTNFGNIKSEVRAALALDNCRSSTTRDLTVHLIGRFKSGNRSAKSRERQEDGLENFVTAVGHEHHGGVDPVQFGNGRPQCCGASVGVTVPFDLGGGLGIGLAKGCWGRNWGLIGIETHPNIDLGRVVALKRR
jgi:hypothetical protein